MLGLNAAHNISMSSPDESCHADLKVSSFELSSSANDIAEFCDTPLTLARAHRD